jgi:hypothetical protein
LIQEEVDSISPTGFLNEVVENETLDVEVDSECAVKEM